MQTYTRNQLAAVCGISPQRIGQLVNEGILTRRADMTFDFPEAVTEYIRFAQHRRSSDEPRADGLPSLRESQARKMAMDADLSETKLAAVRSESITLAEIRDRDEKIKIAVNRGLARLPDIALDLAGMNPAQMKNVLTDTCREILTELADDKSELWK